MRTRVERKEEGQSLVLATIAIVVIFVFVVLAVDVAVARCCARLHVPDPLARSGPDHPAIREWHSIMYCKEISE